jgi:hypothetical protein
MLSFVQVPFSYRGLASQRKRHPTSSRPCRAYRSTGDLGLPIDEAGSSARSQSSLTFCETNALSDIADCPHCFTRMIPMQDGTCPSCRKNTLDTRGLNPNFTVVRLRRGETPPEICFNCGCYTNRYVSLTCEEPRVDRTRVSDGNLIATALGLLFGTLIISPAAVNSLNFRVPRCENCHDLPEHRRMNYEEEWVDIIAHKNLKAKANQD